MHWSWQNREVHFTQEVHAQEPEVVLVEVKIDWTKERIKQEIKETFPEDPETALKIARCESNFNPDAVNRNNPNGTIDSGIFQINSVHNSRLEKLDIDVFDPEDNIRFARMLYDNRGWLDWVCYTHKLI